MAAPFARSNAMLARIAALMSTMAQGMALNAAIAALGDYRSRGKGGKHRKMCRTNWFKGNASKYQPHQGVAECARRVRQMQAGRAL